MTEKISLKRSQGGKAGSRGRSRKWVGRAGLSAAPPSRFRLWACNRAAASGRCSLPTVIVGGLGGVPVPVPRAPLKCEARSEVEDAPAKWHKL